MVAGLHGLALVLHLVAAGLVFRSLAEGRRGVSRSVLILAALAVIAHGLGLAAFAAVHAELPLVGLGPGLSTAAFLVALFLIVVALVRDAQPLAVVLTPISALLLISALLIGIEPAGQAVSFRGIWFGLHVLLAFAGYAGLTVAFAAGLLYLLQFRELRDKRFGRMFRFFPPLETLDRIGRTALAIGFPSLTVALVIGWAWIARFQRSFALGDPKVVWGVLTWLVFVVALLAHSRGATRHRRGAMVTVVGFVVVIVAYVLLRSLAAGGRLFL